MEVKNRILAAVVAACALSTGAAQAAIIADSVAEFSATTNGANGWSYGYFNSPWDGNTFVNYDVVLGSSGAEYWTSTGDNGAISRDKSGAGGSHKHVVRRWTSTVAGEVTINVTVQKLDGTVNPYNNGGYIRVMDNNVDLLGPDYIPGTDTATRNYSITTTVGVGDKVDFLLFDNGNNGWDTYIYTATISAVPEPAAVGILGLGAMGLLAARRRRT